jgi:hypothetical protein
MGRPIPNEKSFFGPHRRWARVSWRRSGRGHIIALDGAIISPQAAPICIEVNPCRRNWRSFTRQPVFNDWARTSVHDEPRTPKGACYERLDGHCAVA